MTLHDRIISLKPIGHTSQVSAIHFNNAKMRAAQLASEADELMAEMAEALEQAITSIQDSGYPNDSVAVRAGREAIAKYNAYKEQSNEQ